MKKAPIFLLCVLFLLGALGPRVYAQNAQDGTPEKIVLVADLSGSVARFDTKNNLQEAFLLAIGLAPDQARVAVVGVTSEIAVETDFLNPTDAAARKELQTTVQNLTYRGNTNLVLGLETAIEKLDGRGRVILYGDISEGGLMPSTAAAVAERTNRAVELARECQKSGVAVDFIFAGERPEDSELAGALEQIAAKSGGKSLRAQTAAELSEKTADLMFSAYPYFMQTQTSVNTSEDMQTLAVSMPSEHVHRARVYVPSSVGIQASYAGAGLETQKQSTYSLLDLSAPARDGLSLSIARTDRPLTIYLIADYRLEARAEIRSEVIAPQEKEEAVRQLTTVTLDVIDQNSGQSILDARTAELFSAALTLTAPDGTAQTIQAEILDHGGYQFVIEPQYGRYEMEAVLLSGGYALPAVTAAFAVEDIRPVETPWTLSMTAAAVMGALLVLAAVWFALYRRKKVQHQGAVQTMDRNRFTGRLQVATVIAGGGNQEIAPFIFQLDRVREESKLSLAQLYEASGISYQAPQGERILFLPGPGGSVIVKNNSGCKILAAGRTYGMKEKIQLHYDQKIYIILEENEHELEVYYRPTREDSFSGKKLAVGARS